MKIFKKSSYKGKLTDFGILNFYKINKDYSPWIYSPQLVIFLFFEHLVSNDRFIIKNWPINSWKASRKKLTQEKLSLQCGIDRSYMGRIERGEVNITVEKLYEIAMELEIEVQELLP